MPQEWGGVTKLGDENDVITVEVNNVLAEKKINNVFGVIKGFVDAGTMICSFNKCTMISHTVYLKECE